MMIRWVLARIIENFIDVITPMSIFFRELFDIGPKVFVAPEVFVASSSSIFALEFLYLLLSLKFGNP